MMYEFPNVDWIVVGWVLILDHNETEQVNLGLRITIFRRPDVIKL
jgi:hypothetical protein